LGTQFDWAGPPSSWAHPRCPLLAHVEVCPFDNLMETGTFGENSDFRFISQGGEKGLPGMQHQFMAPQRDKLSALLWSTANSGLPSVLQGYACRQLLLHDEQRKRICLTSDCKPLNPPKTSRKPRSVPVILPASRPTSCAPKPTKAAGVSTGGRSPPPTLARLCRHCCTTLRALMPLCALCTPWKPSAASSSCCSSPHCCSAWSTA